MTKKPRPRRRRPLRPGHAVVRYNDGSSYHLARIVDWAPVSEGAGGVVLHQRPPRRCRDQGLIQHWIPGHNVDVVMVRQRTTHRIQTRPGPYRESIMRQLVSAIKRLFR